MSGTNRPSIASIPAASAAATESARCPMSAPSSEADILAWVMGRRLREGLVWRGGDGWSVRACVRDSTNARPRVCWKAVPAAMRVVDILFRIVLTS